LKIKESEVITLLHEYPSGKGFRFASSYRTGRLSCLIKVSTDGGIVDSWFVCSHPELVQTIVEGNLCSMLVGCDPLDLWPSVL
jgi:hypothetical protein